MGSNHNWRIKWTTERQQNFYAELGGSDMILVAETDQGLRPGTEIIRGLYQGVARKQKHPLSHHATLYGCRSRLLTKFAIKFMYINKNTNAKLRFPVSMQVRNKWTGMYTNQTMG